MGGAQEDTNSWLGDEDTAEMDTKDKCYDGSNMEFEDKLLKPHDMVPKSSTDPFTWEDSSNSQEPIYERKKERLVIKFRRISDSYYMVDEIATTPDCTFKYFNYKSERYSFPTSFHVTPEKKSTPSKSKVFRCKTCRKVFSKMGTLKTHRRTHAAFAPGSYTPGDFAKRFSRETVSKEPYKPTAHLQLLEKLEIHPRTYPGYLDSQATLPYIKPGQPLQIGEDRFNIGDMIGEGGFAKVYAVTWENGPPEDRDSVFKIQMPANDWEWYILNQVHQRFSSLNHPLKEGTTSWDDGFMAAARCYTYRNGAVLVSRMQRMGTLLDLVNLTKNCDRSIVEPIAIYLTAELLGLIELLHSMKIVHADIKPDNFLMRHTPSTQSSPSLQLIDFGKAVDVVLEPEEESTPPQQEAQADVGKQEGVQEEAPAAEDKSSVEKDLKVDAEKEKVNGEAAEPEIKSNGMKEEGKGRTGKYHLDYFGIAGAAYCLLFGKYIEVGIVKNRWVVKGSFKRWWQVKVWEQFFGDMLNPKSEDKDCLPSLLEWRERLLSLFEMEDLRDGLAKAREIIEVKFLEKWRRTF